MSIPLMKLLLLLLLVSASVRFSESAAASCTRKWWPSRDSLSEYEAVKSLFIQPVDNCIVTASRDSVVHLVTFNTSSGLCTHFRCRLGLSHCRKCRNVNNGTQQVWTDSNDCWTTVQHRVSGSVDFYRTWSEYQSEFGEGPDRNYWIGLNTLHALTSSGARKLRFLMKPWNNSESWAEYSSFSVGPESDNFRLSVSGFSGSPGIRDSLSYHSGRQFTTKDADHDLHPQNCAVKYFGAWWFGSCFTTHPNGQYKDIALAIAGPYVQGITWYNPFGLYYSLKEMEILIL